MSLINIWSNPNNPIRTSKSGHYLSSVDLILDAENRIFTATRIAWEWIKISQKCCGILFRIMPIETINYVCLLYGFQLVFDASEIYNNKWIQLMHIIQSILESSGMKTCHWIKQWTRSQNCKWKKKSCVNLTEITNRNYFIFFFLSKNSNGLIASGDTQKGAPNKN